MSNIGATTITIIGSIVALAMLAVVVSKRGQAPQVLQAGGSALAGIIGAAVSPLGSGNQGATSFGSASNNIAGVSL